MKYIIGIASVIFLFIATGCEKVIEPGELPDQDPRLVMNSILYPDSEILVRLSLSKGILSNRSYKVVDNATCDVYENGVYLGKLKGTGSGYYRGPAMAKTGHEYTIKVTASGYDGVSATSSIPKNVSINSVQRYDTTASTLSATEYSTSSGVVKTFGGSLRFKLKVTDDPAVKNYYGIEPVVILHYASGDSDEVFTYISSGDESLSGQGNYYGSNMLQFDDQGLSSGKDIPLDIRMYLSTNIPLSDPLKAIRIRMKLYNFSSDYYRYLVTFNDQRYTSASFFAEPVQVYSNVSNGMGILGGVNINTVPFYP